MPKQFTNSDCFERSDIVVIAHSPHTGKRAEVVTNAARGGHNMGSEVYVVRVFDVENTLLMLPASQLYRVNCEIAKQLEGIPRG